MEETQSAYAEGDKIQNLKYKVSNEPGSGETDPDQEDTELRMTKEERSAVADDYLFEDEQSEGSEIEFLRIYLLEHRRSL